MYARKATFYLARETRHATSLLFLWIYQKAVINREMEGGPGGLIESQCYWKIGHLRSLPSC